MNESARDILEKVSVAEGWSEATEISVLCDFIDWIQEGQPVFDKWPGTEILLEEFEKYLRQRGSA